MKREIELGGQTITYTIRTSSRARYLRMTVSLKDGLVVTVPRYGSERMVESFLRQKAAWILKQLRRMQKLKGKITGFEVGLSIASGDGKEHMALVSALINLPVGIRFAALTKEGVIDL